MWPRYIIFLALYVITNITYAENGNQLYKLAYELRFSGKKHKAIGKYEEALKKGESTGDTQLQMNCHIQLAELKDNVINYQEALDHYKSFSALYKKQMSQKTKALEESVTDLTNEVEYADLIIAEKNKVINLQRIILLISIIGGLILAVLLFFVYHALKINKANNKLLREKNTLIRHQKEIVEEKNKEITDSISYAKRLQIAILPPIDLLQKDFKDYFVYYKPKDEVSGDFYWIEKSQGLTFVAVADSTGHGVPGAIVSVVCSSALNRSVNEFNLFSPAAILNKTRELVIRTFAKSGNNVKDGMDICLCAFDQKKGKLIFCGANNPLWLVRKISGQSKSKLTAEYDLIKNDYAMLEFKPNRQPVGLYEDMKSFTDMEIDIKKGDFIYLITDGYADQFGGEKGKKLKYKTLKKILLDRAQDSGEKQNNELEKFMDNWKSNYEQLDDICVVGLKI